MIRRKFYLLFIVLIFLSVTCNKKKGWNDDLKIDLIRKIGVEIARTTEEEPYQFSVIYSIDCDNEGNIYVLDGKENCLKVFDKNGKFLKKLFREGKGPQEIINTYKIVINKFSGNLFILQEYGFQLKEFDPLGKFIKLYTLPERIRYHFEFIDRDRIVYIAGKKIGNNINNNFKIINLNTLKIEKELDHVHREEPIINSQMRFIVINGILWTCPGDEMRLVAFDLNSGKEIKSIKIKEEYRKYKILRHTNWISALVFNYAIPIKINKKMYVLITKIDHFQESTYSPKSCKFLLYSFKDGSLIKLKKILEIKEDSAVLGTIWQNRFIFYKYDPPIIKIFEIKRTTKG
jgi:hypothetical protein